MNAKHIESRFAEMGARLKVREIPSRWHRGGRKWLDPTDFAVDIKHDGKGPFFELRVPTRLSETVKATVRVVMNTETQSRTMANVAFLD